MDNEKLATVISMKSRVRIDPADPILMVATISETVHAKILAGVQKIMTDGLNQMSAASAQAEAAARVKAEKIVTQGADWASERIRQAGDAVVAKIAAERQALQDEAATVTRWVKRGIVAAALCGMAAVAAAAGAALAMGFPWR